MFFNKEYKYCNNIIKSDKTIIAKPPLWVSLPLSVEGVKYKFKGEIGDIVKHGEVIASSENGTLNKISTINGKISSINEYPLPDKDYSFCVNLDWEGDKKIETTITNSPTKENISNMINKFGITRLKKLKDCTENKGKHQILIDLSSNRRNLNLNKFIAKKYFKSVLSGIKMLSSYLDENVLIHIYIDRETYEKINKYMLDLNLDNLEIKFSKIKKQYLKFFNSVKSIDPQSLIDLYEAVKYGAIPTSRIIAVSGLSIKNPGYYLVRVGTPLSEVMAIAGGLKHTYEEIDDFKEQALIAYQDERLMKKDVKEEKNKNKKIEKQKQLELKMKEARKKVYSKREDYYRKYRLCLSKVKFIVKNKKIAALNDKTPVTENLDAVLFLSNIEHRRFCKKPDKG